MKETQQNCQLPVGVTAEDIKAWKGRYGENKIKIASLPKDDDGNEFMDVNEHTNLPFV